MKYQCIIFDWDGTLVDSLGRIVSSMHGAANVVGAAPRSDQQVRDIIGLELVEAIITLYPELSHQQVLAMRDNYSRIYVEQESVPTQFFDGIPSLLNDLRGASRILGVATGKSRRGLDRVMGDLAVEDWFHSTRCADETRGKPEPHMVLELLETFKVHPENAVVVGDSHFDLEMATRAGVDCIGVGWGAQDLNNLSRYERATLVDSVASLRKALGFSLT